MKKHLAFLLTLCLILTVLTPMFTLAEELDTTKPTEKSIETPLATALPSPSDSVPPSPSDSVPPSPSDSVPPSPSDSVPPSPSDSVPPSPSDSVAPSPSDSVVPSPLDSVPPSPSATPSPKASVSPKIETVDGKTLYELFLSIEDDSEAENFLKSLSKEQLMAMRIYVLSIKAKNSGSSKTVSVTDAGPLVTPASSADEETPKVQIMKLMAVRALNLTTDKAGVELFKYADPIQNANGTYTLRMESYTTGEVTTTTTGVPADIILVLDQSGSMAYTFDGSTSRQEALRYAVNSFIAQTKATKVSHRIALVTFASDASSSNKFYNVSIEAEYQALIDKAAEMIGTPYDSTNVAAGMTEAKKLFVNPSNSSTHNKVVIVFTDGVPTTSSTFDTGVATDAISTAKSIKDLGATVYTIGIFSGANPSQLFGSHFYYDGHENVPCSGAADSIWGASWDLLYNEDFDSSFIDIAAGNRFLNYLSSNYSVADKIGISFGYFYHPGFSYEEYDECGIGYEITHVFTRRPDGNYFLSAANTTDLNTIFTTISQSIASPTTSLGSNTAVRDVISEYFDLPTNMRTTDVRVSTVACTGIGTDGEYTWADKGTDLSSPNVNIDFGLKTISISGFDYDTQFVTAEEKPEGGHGSKLVISFEVTPRSGIWGGNQVPTNAATSGLYAGNNLVEDFEVPTVDVPINVPFTAKDISIYLGNTVSTSDLYNPIIAPTGVDEWKGHFIDIGGITYSATFDAKPTGDLSPVTVTATVRSRNNPELGAKNVPANASITVYKPEITFCDSSIYLGEKAEYTSNLVSVIWKHGDVVADPVNILGSVPSLSYTYGPVAGWIEDDTTVDVTVNISDWDITQYVTFTNNGSSHAGSTTDKEFAVHVMPCTLTVSKLGCDGAYGDSQTFILHVTGTNLAGCDFANKVNLNIVVKGNTSKTITGLPVGIYTVTENSGWSWRYSATTGTATLSPDKTTDTISVANSLTDLGKLWLSGSNCVQNVFNKKAGVSA